MNGKTGTKNIIRQITQLLDNFDENNFSKPLSIYNGTSIGQHFRHILDFYQCMLRGISEGSVDYASRERNPAIERIPAYARDAFLRIEEAIDAFDEEAEIRVLTDFSSDSSDTRVLVKSTVGRELMFAYDHAVHHIAIIKIGIRTAFPTFDIEDNVGIAPSTLKFWAGEKATDQ